MWRILKMFEYKDCLSQIEFTKPEEELVFFDVGCNINPTSIGEILDDFTELVLSNYPKAKCIGVEPLHCNSYEEKWKNYKNVLLVKKALSNTNESKNFYVPEAHALSSLVDRPVFHTWGEENKPKVVEIECIKLSDLVNQLSIEHIDYLKIDTEGYEYFVLQGAENLLRDNRISVIQMEYGAFPDVGMSVEKIDDYLKDFGYVRIHQNQTEVLYVFVEKYEKENYLQHGGENPDIRSLFWDNNITGVLIEHYKDYMVGKIVEYGCNNGAMVGRVSEYERVDEVVGIDLNSDSIKIAKEKIPPQIFDTNHKVKFLNENLTKLSLDNEYFDFGFTIHTLEHIYPEDVDKVVSEMLRIIKIGGHLMVNLPDKNSYYWEPLHVYRPSMEELNELFVKHGCEVIESYIDQRGGQVGHSQNITALYKKIF